jgi:hypothetical protein
MLYFAASDARLVTWCGMQKPCTCGGEGAYLHVRVDEGLLVLPAELLQELHLLGDAVAQVQHQLLHVLSSDGDLEAKTFKKLLT